VRQNTKMRKLLTLFTILIAYGSQAQTVVSGVVKDHRGKALPAATVTIKDSYDGGITDSTGVFSFKTTEKGEKTLVLTAIGYKLYFPSRPQKKARRP
jgi:vitamin B12 transporter